MPKTVKKKTASNKQQFISSYDIK